MSEPKTIKIYKLKNDVQPFSVWLDSLDKSLQGYVLSKVKKLAAGNFSDCSILKNAEGVKEARIRTASGIRIYFAEYEAGNEIIILLAGGDKDTQQKDIENAKEYWKDYKTRRL